MCGGEAMQSGIGKAWRPCAKAGACLHDGWQRRDVSVAEPLCHAGPLLGRSLSTLVGWLPLPLRQLQDAGVGKASPGILYTISQGGCSYICYRALDL